MSSLETNGNARNKKPPECIAAIHLRKIISILDDYLRQITRTVATNPLLTDEFSGHKMLYFCLVKIMMLQQVQTMKDSQPGELPIFE